MFKTNFSRLFDLACWPKDLPAIYMRDSSSGAPLSVLPGHIWNYTRYGLFFKQKMAFFAKKMQVFPQLII